MAIDIGSLLTGAGGLGSAIGGLFSAFGSSDALNDLIKLEKQKYYDERGRRQWFDKLFMPRYEETVRQAFLPTEEQPGYLRAIGKYERGLGDVVGNLSRIYGRNVGTGQEDAARRRAALVGAKGRADIKSQWDANRLNQIISVLGLGSSTLNTPIQNDLGGAYRTAFNNYNSDAAAGFGGFGNAMQNLGFMYGKRGGNNDNDGYVDPLTGQPR